MTIFHAWPLYKKVKLVERVTFVPLVLYIRTCLTKISSLSVNSHLIRFFIMSQRFVCALLTASVVCCTLAENNEFAAVSEFVKKQSTEDKPSSNVVHGKNSSKTSHLNSIVPDGEQSGHEKNMEHKHPRTTGHRLESDSRDKSSILKRS